jgi:steroid delta-isomerase-like uncharacterized protein
MGVVLAGTAAQAMHAQDATPATGSETCPAPSLEEGKALVQRYWDEVWNAKNDAALTEVFSPDEVHHWGVGGDTVGPEEFLSRITAFREAFPDLTFRIEHLVGEGDVFVSRWVATGTHDGEWMGIAATGKKIEYSGVNLFRIACGKIVESWGEANHLGLLRQLEGDAAGMSGTDHTSEDAASTPTS